MNTFFPDVIKTNTDYLLFVGIVFLLFGGLSWTMHRRTVAQGMLTAEHRLPHGLLKLQRVSLVLILFVHVIGWYIADVAGDDQRLKNQELVEGIAPTFAYELQKMGHFGVRIATAANDEQYVDIISTVGKWMAINPDIERIYTLRKLPDGSNVYVIAPGTINRNEQEHMYQTMRLPIGELFPRSGPELEEAFLGTGTFTSTPHLTGSKKILSSFVPIYDSSGRTEAVLGIDFDASKWDGKILMARLTVMFCLMLLFLPIFVIYWMLWNNRIEKQRMKLHQQELAESEDRFRKLSNATFEGIVIAEDGLVLEVNQTFATMFGYKQWEMIGMDVLDLTAPEAHERIKPYVNSTQDTSYESVGLRKDGTKFDVELVGTPCQYQGRHARVIAVRDVTERKRSEEMINRMAYHDTLTSLPNRVLFHERVDMALRQAEYHNSKAAILFLDLDRFKLVNDTLGHSMGDQLLQGVAERLRGCVRPDDVVARMGGDEFTVLLKNIEHPEEAADVAMKIINSLRQPFKIDEYELHTTTSIGISMYPQDGDDTQMLMKNADTAMYRAKDQGRNNFSFYSPAMNNLGIERLELENGLRYALERDELVVYYQPRLNIITGQIVGMEALIRWQHPTLGLVPPGKFIPLAEETGLIVPIGEWVLETACRDTKRWIDAGYPPMQVAVNLSARQFQSSGLVEKIALVLEETGLDPLHLELEITESITMQDVDFTIFTLKELSRMGIHIAVDDFGTGYSSLSYLKHFPLNTLKVDQSFVRELTNDSYNKAIVTTVIYLAQNLNLKVIAEGVETEEQLKYLRDFHCDEAQGYLFSRPVPAAEFERLLVRNQPEKHPLITE